MDENAYDWESILGKLIAYAFVLLDDILNINEKSELAKDFAVEAITKYLENKEKFDPIRNSNLLWYLKYNILRQLISNHKKSGKIIKEVKIDNAHYKEEFLEKLYMENVDYDNNIDAAKMLSDIVELIKNDDELHAVFHARYYLGLKKSEVCEELKISPDKYNNRIKRLKRLSKKYLLTLKT